MFEILTIAYPIAAVIILIVTGCINAKKLRDACNRRPTINRNYRKKSK